MTILPAKGFWQRVKGRLLLMGHPNYAQFKHDLVSVWTGK